MFNFLHNNTPITFIVIFFHDFDIIKCLTTSAKLSLSKNMVVPVKNSFFYVHILRHFLFEMPRHKKILTLKLRPIGVNLYACSVRCRTIDLTFRRNRGIQTTRSTTSTALSVLQVRGRFLVLLLLQCPYINQGTAAIHQQTHDFFQGLYTPLLNKEPMTLKLLRYASYKGNARRSSEKPDLWFPGPRRGRTCIKTIESKKLSVTF